MATSSGDISKLVFKRNIDPTAGNYVLDFQMLKLLDEIEGTRNVAELSGRLGLDVPEVKAACARLFQQRLILPAQPISPSLPEPDQNFSSHIPGSESSESIPVAIPDYVEEVEEDKQGFADSLSDSMQFDDDESLTRLDLSSDSDGGDAELGSAPVDELAFADDLPGGLQFDDDLSLDRFDLLSDSGGLEAEINSLEIDADVFPDGLSDASREAEGGSPIRLERRSPPTGPDPEYSGAVTQEAASIWEDTKKVRKKHDWDWPDHAPSVFDSRNGNKPVKGGGSALFSDSGSLDSVFDSGNGNKSAKDGLPALFSDSGSFDSVPESRTAPRNGSADIFTIGMPERKKNDDPSGAFAAVRKSNPARSDTDFQFAAALQPDRSTGDEVPRPRENSEAIGHFEKGVALLQHSAFKEALQHFEMALELDPQNRLCRANIQRIQEKLAPDEV
jgi:hypothetical protein